MKSRIQHGSPSCIAKCKARKVAHEDEQPGNCKEANRHSPQHLLPKTWSYSQTTKVTFEQRAVDSEENPLSIRLMLRPVWMCPNRGTFLPKAKVEQYASRWVYDGFESVEKGVSRGWPMRLESSTCVRKWKSSKSSSPCMSCISLPPFPGTVSFEGCYHSERLPAYPNKKNG